MDDKPSLQYIKNNQLATIEQPYNAIVKVEPVGLGEYTFNNSTPKFVLISLIIYSQHCKYVEPVVSTEIVSVSPL